MKHTFLSCYPREIKTLYPNKDLHYNAYNNFIHNKQNLETTQRSQSGKWINSLWRSIPMKYYLAKKIVQLLICTTMRMNLKNIVLSAKSEGQKTSNDKWFHLCELLEMANPEINDCQGAWEEEADCKGS